jgi:hypothetical protein
MLMVLGFFSAMGGLGEAEPPFDCARTLKLIVSNAQTIRENTEIFGGTDVLII